jgi:hypothetical protein
MARARYHAAHYKKDSRTMRLPLALASPALTVVAHRAGLRFTLQGVPRNQARDAAGRAFEHWLDFGYRC